MNRSNWRLILEAGTTIATLGTLGYVAVSVYQARHENGLATSQLVDVATKVRGDVNARVVAHILPVVKSKNLVIAVTESCPYCKRSEPFYRSLLKRSVAGTRDLQVVFAFPSSANDESMRSFRGPNAPEFSTVKTDFTALGVHATPTILLLGPDRKPIHRWVGILTPVQEQELLRSL